MGSTFMIPVGLQALAVAYPSRRMSNDYWRRRYPELVKNAEQHASKRVWQAPQTPTPFDLAMEPHFHDAFLNTKKQH